MSSIPHKDLMLNVDGFGPIAEAENVLIKPMTVFVGPSNAGKSYLAILLYAISRGLNDVPRHVHPARMKRYFEHYGTLIDGIRDMPYDSITAERHSLSRWRDEAVVQYDWKESSSEVQRIVNALHSDWLKIVDRSVSEAITSFFEATRLNELAPHSTVTHIGTTFTLCVHDRFFDWNIVCDNGHLKSDSSLLPLLLPESVSMLLATEADERATALNDFSKYQLLDGIHTSFGAQFHSLDHMTYFPAARSGIIASHRTLNRNLVASVFSAGSDRELVQHNRIINDFLENLLQIEAYAGASDKYARQMAEVLENALINGGIVADPAEFGPPDFVYSQQDFRIPLTRSSSMVTELAPIVLFLKHFLRKGELLIIEEPEAHLHPAAQQKFAAVLALMVRNGFRILITTHSHYMVEQISDFVGASYLSPEKRRELLRLGPVLEEQDIYLNEDEVGVYSFDNSNGSTTVKNIPFDENFAYVPEDHNHALTEQFNRNVRIMRAQRNGHSVNGHDGE